MNFDFMAQNQIVENLLNACVAALAHLPEPEKFTMVEALKDFETFGAPVMWSHYDLDPGDELELSQDEKRQVIEEFIESYECKDADWNDISGRAKDFSASKLF